MEQNKSNKPQIFDCFTFFNELDLLEIRLNELHSVVDYFVLVEANFTHQGQTKNYIFEENKQRYASFLDKIIHVKLDKMPPTGIYHEDQSWNLEHYQRNGISLGLQKALPNDIILVSDVDEIPNKDVLAQYFVNVKETKILLMRNFYYFVDFEVKNNFNLKYYFLGKILQIPKYYYKYINTIAWQATVIILKNNFTTAQDCREKLRFIQPKNTYIKNGGWHFSYLGGIDKIITKIASFAHIEVAEKNYTKNDISNLIKNGKVLHDNKIKTKKINITNAMPQWMVANINAFKNLYSVTYDK